MPETAGVATVFNAGVQGALPPAREFFIGIHWYHALLNFRDSSAELEVSRFCDRTLEGGRTLGARTARTVAAVGTTMPRIVGRRTGTVTTRRTATTTAFALP